MIKKVQGKLYFQVDKIQIRYIDSNKREEKGLEREFRLVV